jgi:hypothetical protein
MGEHNIVYGAKAGVPTVRYGDTRISVPMSGTAMLLYRTEMLDAQPW